MNIAILFYGELRWFDQFNESFKQYFLHHFNNDNIQYFAHLWSDPDNTLINTFKNTFTPISATVEPQLSNDRIKTLLGTNTQDFYLKFRSQLYSFDRCVSLLDNFLKSSDFNFDLYVKLRTDMIFLENVVSSFDNDSIYVNKTKFDITNYVNDFGFFTKKYDNVKTIANMGYCLDSIIESLCTDTKPASWGTLPTDFAHEEILARYLKIKKISTKYLNFSIDLARHHK